MNEIFLFLEKKIKNKNKNNATTLNLIDRDKKGGAYSTIILLLINADDHNITKIIGIVFRIWTTFLFGELSK